MQFSLHSTGGAPTQVYDFLLQNKSSVRYLSLHNPNWSFPAEAVSIRSLTHLDFQGIFPGDSRAFADILANGHQLESLRLECHLECTASTQFREHPTALPFLHHFAFSLIGYRVNDHDLFPAISEFLKGRSALRTLQLTVPSADWALKRLGYDATVWGVLPSLTSLRSLTATLPKDVAAPVAMWLVPRGVQALTLQALAPVNTLEFVSVRLFPLPLFLRALIPPSLSFVRVATARRDAATTAIHWSVALPRRGRTVGHRAGLPDGQRRADRRRVLHCVQGERAGPAGGVAEGPHAVQRPGLVGLLWVPRGGVEGSDAVLLALPLSRYAFYPSKM